MEAESLNARCRRVWVCNRCGNCLEHCKHKVESNFREDLSMPCSVKIEERHPEDYCHKCGGPNFSWWVPSLLWNKFVRAQDESEIICPLCFFALAKDAGNNWTWAIVPDFTTDDYDKQLALRAGRKIAEATEQTPEEYAVIVQDALSQSAAVFAIVQRDQWLQWADSHTGHRHYLASAMRRDIDKMLKIGGPFLYHNGRYIRKEPLEFLGPEEDCGACFAELGGVGRCTIHHRVQPASESVVRSAKRAANKIYYFMYPHTQRDGQYLPEHATIIEDEFNGESKRSLKDQVYEDLVYRMARHIRNSDEIAPLTWGSQGMTLLEDLREIDPDRYDREVKETQDGTQSGGEDTPDFRRI